MEIVIIGLFYFINLFDAAPVDDDTQEVPEAKSIVIIDSDTVFKILIIYIVFGVIIHKYYFSKFKQTSRYFILDILVLFTFPISIFVYAAIEIKTLFSRMRRVSASHDEESLVE